METFLRSFLKLEVSSENTMTLSAAFRLANCFIGMTDGTNHDVAHRHGGLFSVTTSSGRRPSRKVCFRGAGMEPDDQENDKPHAGL